eukprot:CAMPEP_0201922282 /NCGR_PEP_ID=MMETSP0903-20130614/10358_1 /ASSEMBLY_ACC=CAM_ASM_000552 /TAXON_ID=420261 /ORGANISM="Thalassiosira antarctica, Strain CCMP982" /LENGTH=1043 /DNA_ID=CAMNT_0048459387 /DNA_START=185 /DNA_END=3316 /DNA_ORIENTATION=-
MARKKSKASSVKKTGRRDNGANFNPTIRDNKIQYKTLIVVGAGIVALLVITIFYALSSNNLPSEIQKDPQKSKEKEAFLKWFVENGGTFHPIGWDNDRAVNVTIEEFPSFGGWGLALPIPPKSSRPSDECQSETTDGQCIVKNEKSPVIKHLDPLFTVPSSIIITVTSITDAYASSASPFFLPDFYFTVNKILRQAFPNELGLAAHGMGLVQQDVVIAMSLMVEDCQHRHGRFKSRWGPYLDVLPQYTIPRLDTFGDEEYAALQDEKLEYTGRKSRRLLEQMYFNGGSGVNGPSLKAVVQDMILHKHGPTSSLRPIPESCISFETFHRFVAIVSSRAMLLDGVKHLTPLAEMINYSPKVAAHHTEDLIRAPFDLYHTGSGDRWDRSITVRSDRDIFITETSGEAAPIQLFEDYGPVDSSLFLEAHGFVPHENPHNCAVISGSFFLRRNAATGRYDETVELVLQALKALYLIHPEEFDVFEDVCVTGGLRLVDDGDAIGRKPASDSIAITSLLLSDSDNLVWNMIENYYGETFVSLRDKCMAAIRSGDAERMELRCARYPGSDSIVKQGLRTAARRAIESFEDKSDTEAKLLLQLQHAESQGRDRLAVVLRFRIEERKILSQIAHSQDEFVHHENDDIVTNQIDSSESLDNLEANLIAFNSFVESLELPTNKIEPKLVGNGMRIGTCATEDLEVGDAYISLPANSVIDVTTALAGVDEASDFATLLRKYSNMDDPQHDDDFDALLLYLLHERFLLKEQSRWWPWLELLPSVEEMGAFHPLFFQEEEIDRHLAGSDVRGFVLRYQRRAAERHAALSSDLDANLVLGSDVLLDKQKVYWATAILDSRSISWGGRRHLSPLLDLVNADDKGLAHETRLEDSEDMKQKVAVTRASRPVKKGEQVFENYAQPNYLLFTYLGFLVEGNTNDCALLDGLSIHRNDPGAKYAHQLQSTAPTFCIRDLQSVEELAHFLLVKHGLTFENSSDSKINDKVRPYLIEVLEGRVSRLMEAMDTTIDVDSRLRFMRQIVKNDLMHFQHALNTHVLVQN